MNAQALYDPMNEHDACGVGLVANINNVASHQIVLQGITVLKRLMHRGAAGGDPEMPLMRRSRRLPLPRACRC